MPISIRNVTPEDAPSLAHILITANESAFRGIVPDKCLEFTEVESAANWRKFFTKGIPEGDKFIVAETADKKVIAYAWGKSYTQVDDFSGELFQIMVLP